MSKLYRNGLARLKKFCRKSSFYLILTLINCVCDLDYRQSIFGRLQWLTIRCALQCCNIYVFIIPTYILSKSMKRKHIDLFWNALFEFSVSFDIFDSFNLIQLLKANLHYFSWVNIVEWNFLRKLYSVNTIDWTSSVIRTI